MRKWSILPALCAVVAGCLTERGSVAAEADVAAFYKGKQISLYIGFPVGGGFDNYARLIARYMGNYVPGNPTFVPVNMGGAGGGVLTSYLLNVAARDGTAIGAVAPGPIVAPLLTDAKLYDPRPLIYLGSANS